MLKKRKLNYLLAGLVLLSLVGCGSSNSTNFNGGPSANNALVKIANYADSNTNPTPTVQDYINAGVTGVYAANLNAVNVKVDGVTKVDADTTAEVQAIVDTVADVTKSTVRVYENTVIADNTTTTIIELQAKDSSGNDITTGGETVVFTQNGSATIENITDVGNGMYTATIKNSIAQTVKINATIGGDAVTDTATITFTVDADVTKSTVDVNATHVVADGTSQATITLQAKDSNGNDITTGGETVVFDQNGSATISTVADNDNGTYIATITNNTAESVKISATIGAVAVTDTANITFDSKPFPANIMIDDSNLTSIIASVYDDTPYSPAVDVQGVIDMNAASSGKAVSVPYTVISSPATLPAYSTTFTIDSSAAEDIESGIVATFAWAEQTNLPVGTGRFTAYITIDDTAGNSDNVYKAKKLDIDDNTSGLVAATFNYPTDNAGNTGTLTLKIMPGIPDRMFGVADNNGDATTHKFLYLPVTNPTTGKTWLNNNLGAEYANANSADFDPAQQATASDDWRAYGSLFQWGRKADGHELIDWRTSGNGEGVGVNGTTSTNADNPTDALFITEDSDPYDWRINQDDTLWAGESSTNNVCPQGYRLPLNPNGANDNANEWYEETQTWSSQDPAGAMASVLKLPMTGYRSYFGNGAVYNEGSYGYYWNGSVNGTNASMMYFYNSYSSHMGTNYDGYRALGHAVRCIKN